MNVEAEKPILLSYKLLAKLDQISDLTDAVKIALRLYPELIFTINLCIEELITNTILYGFKDIEVGEIEVTIYLNVGNIEVLIEDKAPAFNPFLSVPELNVNTPLDDRVVGGLGIYFVKRMMDDFNYIHNDRGNQITIFKKIS